MIRENGNNLRYKRTVNIHRGTILVKRTLHIFTMCNKILYTIIGGDFHNSVDSSCVRTGSGRGRIGSSYIRSGSGTTRHGSSSCSGGSGSFGGGSGSCGGSDRGASCGGRSCGRSKSGSGGFMINNSSPNSSSGWFGLFSGRNGVGHCALAGFSIV